MWMLIMMFESLLITFGYIFEFIFQLISTFFTSQSINQLITLDKCHRIKNEKTALNYRLDSARSTIKFKIKNTMINSGIELSILDRTFTHHVLLLMEKTLVCIQIESHWLSLVQHPNEED